MFGKIQSDKIEGHFGYMRKLAGGNPQPTCRQFYEGESIIRMTSLCKLSGYSLGEVKTSLTKVQDYQLHKDLGNVDQLKQAVIEYMATEIFEEDFVP